MIAPETTKNLHSSRRRVPSRRSAHPMTQHPSAEAAPSAPIGHAVVTSRGEAIGDVTLDALEGLDDAVFEALAGDADALDEATARWRAAVRRVNPKLLEESRRVYSRRARSVWRHANSSLAERLPLAYAALEILGLVGGRLDAAPADEARDRAV